MVSVFVFLLSLKTLLQTSPPSLDPGKPVWVLTAFLFLPFPRAVLTAYMCLVSPEPAEWGLLLRMLTIYLQSLALAALLCALGAATRWGGVWVRC